MALARVLMTAPQDGHLWKKGDALIVNENGKVLGSIKEVGGLYSVIEYNNKLEILNRFMFVSREDAIAYAMVEF